NAEHNEEEAELIREAYRRFLLDESISAIARDWQQRGVHQPSGREWTAQRLRVLLGSARNAGELTVRGGAVVGDATGKSIVDREKIILSHCDDRAAALAGDVDGLELRRQRLRDIAELEGLDDDLRARMREVGDLIRTRRTELDRVGSGSILTMLPDGKELASM